MNSFADELAELIDRWRDAIGTTDDELIVAMMDEIEKLEPDDDDD